MRFNAFIEAAFLVAVLSSQLLLSSRVHAGDRPVLAVSTNGPSVPFSGCGVINNIDPLCSYFLADEGSFYALSDTGEFKKGDHVHVTGEVFSCPDKCFAQCIRVSQIDPCFSGCGQIVLTQECGLVFLADAGGFYQLENSGKFKPGEHTFVSGSLIDGQCNKNPFCETICILNNIIASCFEACGTIEAAQPFCGLVLHVDNGGFYQLSNYGDFGVGDHVRVAGFIPETCNQIPECSFGCVHQNSIVACPNFVGCGTLGIGPQGCTILATDDGQAFALQTLGEFGPGDYVFVNGLIDPKAQPCFPAGTPLLLNDSIFSCFDACGTIQIGPQGCPVFALDDGTGLFINDTGGFFPGTRLHVTGGLVPDFICPPSFVAPGIVQPVFVEATGDLDCDDDVDSGDLAQLLANWGQCPMPIVPGPCTGNLDGDDDVDASDLAILLAHWS